MYIFLEGDFFGELELIKFFKYGFNLKVIVDLKICIFIKDEMREIMMRNLEIGIKVLEIVGERLLKVESLV